MKFANPNQRLLISIHAPSQRDFQNFKLRQVINSMQSKYKQLKATCYVSIYAIKCEATIYYFLN